VSADIAEVKSVVDTVASDVENIDGEAMRGTDNAALASVCTEDRLSKLDATVSSRATPAQVNTEVDAVLEDYDPPTKAELDAGLAGLNDISAEQVNAEVDAALSDYDAPTKAEMDAGFAGLNDPTAADIADAVWDEALGDHLSSGSTGASLNAAGGGAAGVTTITEETLDVSGAALGKVETDEHIAIVGATVAV